LPNLPVDTVTIRDFVQSEMDKRGMSGREFARFADVSSATIVRLLNDDQPNPELQSLRKIARATGVPLNVILAITFPDVAGELESLPSDVLLTAFRLAALPEDYRRVISGIIENQKLLGGKKQKG